MSKKRMIDTDMLESDIFLDLPISAKILYFYFILKADDDGVIAKPKAITTEMQATIEDLQTLIDTSYVLSFPNGIVRVKRWEMHNTIPKDCYKPTIYQEDFETLVVQSDESYDKKEILEKSKDDQKKGESSGKKEPYNYASAYIEEYWKKIDNLYPSRNGLTTAHQYYLDKFIGIPFENMEELAKMIYEAVKIYLADVKGKYCDKKYVQNLDNWFKRDYDEYMRRAREELEKQGEE